MKIQNVVALALAAVGTILGAQELAPRDPQFTPDGELIRPENYREWIYLSTGLGMTYGTGRPSAEPKFDNVFVTPQAYKAFLQTGLWPDKTIFILEVRASVTSGSINQGGHFQEGIVGLEAHVKDTARFPKKWAFFNLNNTAPSVKAMAADSSCQKCHEKNGAVDETFVQFYPTLVPIAKAKGTFKATAEN